MEPVRVHGGQGALFGRVRGVASDGNGEFSSISGLGNFEFSNLNDFLEQITCLLAFGASFT